MSATATWTFSCDSHEGCLAHATVAATDLADARKTLQEVLDWTWNSTEGDVCPAHITGPIMEVTL